MSKGIILVGAGGHCRSCIDVIESKKEYSIKYLFDANFPEIKKVYNYEVAGKDEDITRFIPEINYAFVTVGQIKNYEPRYRIYKLLKEYGFSIPVIASKFAFVSKRAFINDGTVVMHGAVVNGNSEIGENSIINSLSLIEHDVRIGNNCHISTGARINGSSIIGDNCFIGSGSIIYQDIIIQPGTIIPAGSVIKNNI